MKKNPLVSGFKIESQGFGEYFGFTLDGNHRFLLGSFDVVRNTGKSFTIASILYAKKHIFPTALIMSGTEDNNHFYEKMVPSTFIYGDYDEEVIEKFIKRQKIAKEHLQNPWAVLLIDDCLDKPGIFNKPLQRQLFTRTSLFNALHFELTIRIGYSTNYQS